LLRADGTRSEFNSLFAALAGAEDNAVIELQYEGRTAGPQDPVSLKGKRGIRIRPAETNRPVLEFRWKAEAGTGPLNSAVRMISLTNAGLELYDIDLELWTTSSAVVDRWSLFALTGRSDVALKGCSCTLVNPAELPTAVFDLPARESADLTQMMKDQMLSPSFNVRVEDSVIRGQGALLTQRHCHPATIWLQNVALGLSERLIQIDGSEVVSMPALDEEQEVVNLHLEHVSAVTGEGLLLASSGSFGRLPMIQIDSSDSLFSVLDSSAPLLELTGHEELDQLAERLTWVTRREPNFFELLGPLWLIDAPLSIELDTQRRFDFQQWTTHWSESGEQLVRSGLFRNPRIGPASALDRIVSSDFVLRSGDITPNPAIGATSDRRDAGVDWTLNRIPRELPVTGR
jgi:hypothetical protein